MKKANLNKVITSVAICVLLGVVSGLITSYSVGAGFETIQKPFFHPPDWLLKFVWVILYVLMGYSFAIIWSKPNRSRRTREVIHKAMMLFGIQLALNILWSFFFFKLANPFLALIEILLLWLLIFETIKAFNKIDNYAAKLLIPYLVWVSFTVILNGSIWYLNS